MATRYSALSEQRRRNLNERQFWQSAFLAAELPALIKGNGRRLAPEGIAHLAAEYADAAVNELRKRFHR